MCVASSLVLLTSLVIKMEMIRRARKPWRPRGGAPRASPQRVGQRAAGRVGARALAGGCSGFRCSLAVSSLLPFWGVHAGTRIIPSLLRSSEFSLCFIKPQIKKKILIKICKPLSVSACLALCHTCSETGCLLLSLHYSAWFHLCLELSSLSSFMVAFSTRLVLAQAPVSL